MESERKAIVFGDRLNGKAYGSRLPMRSRDFEIEIYGAKTLRSENDGKEHQIDMLGAAYGEISGRNSKV